MKSLTRWLLILAAVFIGLAALIGIAVILQGKWTWFSFQVILTTCIIGITSLCILSCELARTPSSRNVLPFLGIGLSLTGAMGMLFGMWLSSTSINYWSTIATISIFAVAITHICLLSLPRLPGKLKWLYVVECQIIFGLAIMLSLIPWGILDEPFYILMAVLGIADAAFSLLIPVLAKIHRLQDGIRPKLSHLEEKSLADIEDEIEELEGRLQDLREVQRMLLEKESGK